jgi:hypothetical protein
MATFLRKNLIFDRPLVGNSKVIAEWALCSFRAVATWRRSFRSRNFFWVFFLSSFLPSGRRPGYAGASCRPARVRIPAGAFSCRAKLKYHHYKTQTLHQCPRTPLGLEVPRLGIYIALVSSCRMENVEAPAGKWQSCNSRGEYGHVPSGEWRRHKWKMAKSHGPRVQWPCAQRKMAKPRVENGIVPRAEGKMAKSLGSRGRCPCAQLKMAKSQVENGKVPRAEGKMAMCPAKNGEVPSGQW